MDRVTTNAAGMHALAGMVSLDEGLSGPRLRVFVDQETELTYTGPADLVLAPQEAESAPIIEEGDEENDDAAMFF